MKKETKKDIFIAKSYLGTHAKLIWINIISAHHKLTSHNCFVPMICDDVNQIIGTAAIGFLGKAARLIVFHVSIHSHAFFFNPIIFFFSLRLFSCLSCLQNSVTMTFMIYGCTGYMGSMISDAIAQHDQLSKICILSGRSEKKVKRIANRLALPWSSFSLTDPLLDHYLNQVDVVLNVVRQCECWRKIQYA